jgi:hypothetical protein
MKASITSVYQRGIGLVWAIQLPHTVIYTRDGSLDSAEKKLAEIKKAA